MSGRNLMIVLLVVLAIFGGALWWFQTRAFYQEYTTDMIQIAGNDVPVTAFQGIDATTSPIKLRACMMIEPSELVETPSAPDATPLVAPSWFECFNAKTLARALEAGQAKAFLAASGEFDGTERIIAVYPDGRAFMWRQLNEEFANQ